MLVKNKQSKTADEETTFLKNGGQKVGECLGTISRRKLKRRNRTSKIWITMIVLVLVGVFSVQSYYLYSERQEYEARKVRLEKQLQAEKERKKELENEAEYRKTKKYVEDYAHNQLGLVYPGEIIFKQKN